MKSFLRTKLILISKCVILLSYNCFSQSTSPNFISSSNAYLGSLLIPKSNRSLDKGNPTGIEVNYIHPTNGIKRWERIFHYPEIGVSFIYLDFANNEQLGKGMSIYPFIDFNLTRHKKISLHFKIATSLGVVTKKFDPINNPENLAIGSYLNGFVNLRMNAKIHLTKNLRIETGLGLSHFSNGAMALPNLGINIFSCNLGMGYQFNASAAKLHLDTFSLPSQKIHIVIYTALGLRSISRTDQTKFPAGIISINLERNKGSKTKWNTGLEIAYSTARLTKTKADPSIENYKDLQNIQAGFKIGYAFCVGQLSFPLEMGVFLYSKPQNEYFFHRIGLRYQISKHFIVGFTLKTEWAVADFFEMNVGYTFPCKSNRANKIK